MTSLRTEPGDLHVLVGQAQREQQLGELADGQPAQGRDRLVVHGHGETHRLEPRAVAGRARHLAHIAGELLPARVAFRLGVPPLDVADRALEVRVVRPLPPVPVLVPDVYLGVVAREQGRPGLVRKLAPGGVHPEAEGLGQRLDEPVEVVADGAARPRGDRALLERLGRVGDDQLRVDLHPGAQARAVRAGAPRRVEREAPRLKLVEGQVVVQAREVLGVHPLPVRIGVGEIDEVEDDHAARQVQRGLYGVGQPTAGRVLDGEAVDDHLDVVLFVLLQRRQGTRRRLVEADHHPVYPSPRVALGLQFLEHFAVLALAAPDHGGQHLEPGALLQFEDAVHDLLRALPRDRAAAQRAVRLADAGVQQPQVVVHLGDRADGRPGVAAGGLLVDGDGGRQPVDEVHVGLVHLAEELPRVGGQAFDITALPLGEDRVEGQA